MMIFSSILAARGSQFPPPEHALEIRSKATPKSTVEVIKWDLVKEVNRELSQSSTRLYSSPDSARLEQGENFIFIFPPRQSRGFRSKPAEEEKARKGGDASRLRGNEVIILRVNISPSSIIVLHEFFLQDKKVLDHVIFKVQGRVGKINGDIPTAFAQLFLFWSTWRPATNAALECRYCTWHEALLLYLQFTGSQAFEFGNVTFSQAVYLFKMLSTKLLIQCQAIDDFVEGEPVRWSPDLPLGGFPLTPLCARGKGSPFDG